ncbi:porin family protein [Solitalea lacus]|uniref:porin family protein n=1 Tax=Solitalea lacus TaxID=2911172 RepID=UPI001EDB9BA9|nr:porin family protein [Solitalea lacus]UKJ06649.1 PorT family protein [Solitalea lacus]
MKKFYLLIASVMMAGATMAQSPVKFGIKAGGNFANNTFTNAGFSASPSSLTSFFVGGLVTAEIADKFAFQPEVLLSSQGYKSGEFKNNTLYLNVPLMFKYNVISGLNLQAGPQVGLLLSAKEKLNGESVDIKKNYKNLDLGANFGAEYQFPMGLFLDARYTLGLANIAKLEEGESGSVKNTVFSLGLGFRF